jgi:peptidyl-prolyl cis-trans isomerase B (cyclophilin B)
MSGIKRQKQLAREKFERQEQRRTELAAKRRNRQRLIAIAVALVLVVGAVAWVVAARGGGDPVAGQESSGNPTAAASSATDPKAEPTGEAEGSLDCAPPGTPRADNLTWAVAPTDNPPAGASIMLNTNCGDISIALDPAAPKTIASEVFLVDQGFYDNTSCHRLTTEGIFVLQCGDPKGNGKGGPGYQVPDENLPTDVADGEVTYPAGTVAMANAGPGSSGSQFFIVYKDTVLPAGYTIWGKVTSGLEMVQEIAALGVNGGTADGAPSQPVFIESATVKTA